MGVVSVSLLRSSVFWTVDDLQQAAGRPAFAVLTQNAGPLQLKDGVASRRGFEEDLSALHEFITHLPAEFSTPCMMFTSTLPREGSSTIVAAFAAALARAGSKVLVIDGNLHHPSMHEAFGINARVGLTHVLEQHATLQQAVQTVADLPSLHILSAGPVPPDPFALLLSSDLRGLLQSATDRYDYVLIDSPPAADFPDAFYLASLSNVVFVIAKYGIVQRQPTARLLRKISTPDLLTSGFIVNGALGVSE